MHTGVLTFNPISAPVREERKECADVRESGIAALNLIEEVCVYKTMILKDNAFTIEGKEKLSSMPSKYCHQRSLVYRDLIF